MADRIVKVTMRADFGQYQSEAARAAAATRSIGDSATTSSRKVETASEVASRKVADIRQQLVELSRTRVNIGIGADTIDARVQLDKLKADLAAIDRTDVSARVNAETAAAEAQMRVVQGQLNRIDGQTVTARVNVDDAGSTAIATARVNGLASAVTALSPVIGSIAGVATAGIGVIAPLAVTAGAGVGVLALGFSGLTDASKLLTQQQTATGASLDAINAKLALVNPATLSFARYIQSDLLPAFKDLQGTAAAGMLPGVQEALGNLMPMLPMTRDFVGQMAQKFGDLAVQGSRALMDPFWQSFFAMIEHNAVPIMDNLFRTAGNVATGFAGITTAFMPMARDVSSGITDMSGRFSEWGQNLASSQGFHTFEAYVRENWPKVREIVENLASTIGKMVEAGAPIGSVYLTGFKLLTDVLSALPVGVVQALLEAFLAYRAVSGVAAIVNGIAQGFDNIKTASANIGDAVGRASTAIGGIGSASQDAGGKFGGFLNTVGGGAGKIGGFQGAASGLVGFLGGPWAIGLGAAAILVTGIMNSMQAGTEQTTKWTAELEKGGGAAAGVRAEADKQREKEPFDWMYKLDKFVGFTGSMDEATAAARRHWDALSPLEQANQKVAEWQDTLNRRMHEGTASDEEIRAAHERLNYWTGEVATQQGELTGKTQEASAAISAQGHSYDDLTAVSGAQLGIYTQMLNDKAQHEADSANATATTTGASSKSMQDMVGSVTVSLADYASKLEEDIRAKDNWRDNITKITQRGGTDVASILAGMGEEGARLTDQMANATNEDFDRMKRDLIANTDAAGLGSTESLRKYMDIMKIVGRDGANATAVGIAKELNMSVADVARIAAGYGVNLANGINPVLTAIGAQAINTKTAYVGVLADGGIMEAYAQGGIRDAERYANGGVRENHVAQIARAGTWRVWAEDETGGEAYIPLHPAKRKRSMDIWRETGRRLKAPEVQYNASGAVYQDLFGRVKQQFPSAILTSGYRAGDPGYHGKGLAADIGFAGNNSVPLAAANQWLYDSFKSGILELIYDGPHDSRPDIKNAVDHTYNAQTRADHTTHVHLAAASLAAMLGGKGGDAGGSFMGAAPVRIIMPPVPTFPHNAIAGSATVTSTYARNKAQALADKQYDKEMASYNAGGGGGGGTGVADSGNTAGYRALGRQIAASMGVGNQFGAIDSIFTRESGWNPNAQNKTSSAYGIPQFLNATWAAYGGKTSDPGRQIHAGIQYMKDRYHDPNGAVAFWNAHHWYDDGGIATGRGIMVKNTLAPERTLSPRQTSAFEQLVSREFGASSFSGANGGAFDYAKLAEAIGQRAMIGEVNQNFYGNNDEALAVQELHHAMRVLDAGGKY